MPEIPGTEYLLQLILSLLAVVVAIVVVAWILRHVMRMQSAGGNMRILAGLSLGSRERVVVVEAGDKQLLLGVAPGRVIFLHLFDEPVFTQTTQATNSFAKHLQSKIKGGDPA